MSPLLPVVIQTLPSYTPAFQSIRVTSVPSPVVLTSGVTTAQLTATAVDQRGAAFSLPASTTGPFVTIPVNTLCASSSDTALATTTAQIAFQLLVNVRSVMTGLSVNGNSWGLFELDSDGLGNGTNAKLKFTCDMTSTTNCHFNLRVSGVSVFSNAIATTSLPTGLMPIYVWYDNQTSLTKGMIAFDSSGNVVMSGSAATTANMPATGGVVVLNQHTGVTGSQSSCSWGGMRLFLGVLPANQQFIAPALVGFPGYNGTSPYGTAGWLMNDNTGNSMAQVATSGTFLGPLVLSSGSLTWTGTGGPWSGSYGTPILYGSSNQGVATVNGSGLITRVAVGNCTVYVWDQCTQIATAVTVSVTS